MMKKLTALLLALCMLLAVAPALCEENSPAGNWYMTLADVTVGYMQLNEDGTVVLNMASQADMAGTWTSEGETVTITIDNEPLDFTFDGTSLQSPMFPIPLVREEGKLSMDIIAKMMGGEEYELPEGMTEVEVAAIAMNFMAEYTKLMESASNAGNTGDAGSTGAAEPAAEPAGSEAPNVTIVNGTFKVTESYSGFRGTYIAKIRNDNDVPLWVTGGNLKVKDDAGSEVGKAEYLYTCGSKYLEPGEVSFVSMQADLEANGDYTYEAAIESNTESYRDADRAVTVENPVLKKAESYEGDTMRVTVINDTDAPVPGINIVFALEDAEGNLLQLSTEMLYRHELGANSSITMVTSVDSKVAEFCEANGIEPTTVEALAWVEEK